MVKYIKIGVLLVNFKAVFVLLDIGGLVVWTLSFGVG